MNVSVNIGMCFRKPNYTVKNNHRELSRIDDTIFDVFIT